MLQIRKNILKIVDCKWCSFYNLVVILIYVKNKNESPPRKPFLLPPLFPWFYWGRSGGFFHSNILILARLLIRSKLGMQSKYDSVHGLGLVGVAVGNLVPKPHVSNNIVCYKEKPDVEGKVYDAQEILNQSNL